MGSSSDVDETTTGARPSSGQPGGEGWPTPTPGGGEDRIAVHERRTALDEDRRDGDEPDEQGDRDRLRFASTPSVGYSVIGAEVLDPRQLRRREAGRQDGGTERSVVMVCFRPLRGGEQQCQDPQDPEAPPTDAHAVRPYDPGTAPPMG
jgi:hypothetical protein